MLGQNLCGYKWAAGTSRIAKAFNHIILIQLSTEAASPGWFHRLGRASKSSLTGSNQLNRDPLFSLLRDGSACGQAAPAVGQIFVQVAEGRHQTSVLTYEEMKNMSGEELAKWTYGSQIFMFGLTGYFFIIWTLKFNRLCFSVESSAACGARNLSSR
ncbi:hypothetical protein VTK56DRAFT_4344 [Thermocarpiscus australiensis]